MQETINGLTGANNEADKLKVGPTEIDLDYDEIGRDFILVGGVFWFSMNSILFYHDNAMCC